MCPVCSVNYVPGLYPPLTPPRGRGNKNKKSHTHHFLRTVSTCKAGRNPDHESHEIAEPLASAMLCSSSDSRHKPSPNPSPKGVEIKNTKSHTQHLLLSTSWATCKAGRNRYPHSFPNAC